MFHIDSGQPSMSNIRRASKLTQSVSTSARRTDDPSLLFNGDDYCILPVQQRNRSLSCKNAYQLMKDTNHDIPPI